MSEHTPTPWKTDGVYLVAPFGPTIADCKKSPAIDLKTARTNAAFIVKAVNSHDMLVKKLEEIHDITQDTTLGAECWQKLQNIAATAAAALASIKETV